MPGNRTANGQQVVDIQTEIHRVHAPPAVFVHRDQQRQRPDQVGGIAQQVLPLLQGLVHQTQLAELEIAQPAMNQPAGPARGAVAEVTLLDEAGAETAQCGVAGDTGTVDAATNDDQVKVHVTRRRSGFSRDMSATNSARG